MEERDEIIVFRSFGSTIDANIAKTKLDAYGVPCFLSDENLSNLYPIHSFKFSGVRLHIFARDGEQARQILDEDTSLTI